MPAGNTSNLGSTCSVTALAAKIGAIRLVVAVLLVTSVRKVINVQMPMTMVCGLQPFVTRNCWPIQSDSWVS